MKKRSIKSILGEGCVIFTAAVFLFYLLGTGILPGVVPAMTLKTISCFFAFSLVLSALNALLRAKKPSALFRFILHLTGCMTAFAVIFLGVCGIGETGAKKMIFFFFAILAYTAVMLLAKLFIFLYKKSPFYEKQDI